MNLLPRGVGNRNGVDGSNPLVRVWVVAAVAYRVVKAKAFSSTGKATQWLMLFLPAASFPFCPAPPQVSI